MAQPLRIFISYAHIDEPHKKRLVSFLSTLESSGLVEVWHDRHIDGGEDWRTAIEYALNNCHAALLLVSDAFLSSEFIRSYELRQLLNRRATDGIRVTPIILRPCPWEREAIGALQAWPDNGKPIIKFSDENGDRDQAWTDIALKIAAWAKKAASSASTLPPPPKCPARTKRRQRRGQPLQPL